jgi:hypothetical protein
MTSQRLSLLLVITWRLPLLMLGLLMLVILNRLLHQVLSSPVFSVWCV